MKKASKRRILFAARMATMVGAACFAVSGISETLGQEKEKSRPVYIATEEVAETTYTPEVEEATQPTETAKAVETEEPLIASMDWDKDDSYLLCKIKKNEGNFCSDCSSVVSAAYFANVNSNGNANYNNASNVNGVRPDFTNPHDRT